MANMSNDATYKHCMQCLALEKMFRPHESRVLHEQKEVERVSIDGRVKRRRPNRDLVLEDINCVKFLYSALHPLLVQIMSRVWDGRRGLRNLNCGRKGRRRTLGEWERSPTKPNQTKTFHNTRTHIKWETWRNQSKYDKNWCKLYINKGCCAF